MGAAQRVLTCPSLAHPTGFGPVTSKNSSLFGCCRLGHFAINDVDLLLLQPRLTVVLNPVPCAKG